MESLVCEHVPTVLFFANFLEIVSPEAMSTLVFFNDKEYSMQLIARWPITVTHDGQLLLRLFSYQVFIKAQTSS